MVKRVSVVVLLLAHLGVAGCGGDDPVAVAAVSWARVAPEQIAEAKTYGVPVAFENDLGMRFVLIPAGTFVMGDDPSAPGYFDERRHEVVLGTPFYMGVHEVTNAQFSGFDPEHDSGVLKADAPLQPVVHVTHDEALRFADWVHGQDPRRAYRLPTEAEWEYACRAGTTTRYWYGDVFDGEAEHCGRRVGVRTLPVGSLRHNPWGLFDMLGNAQEWCADLYGRYPADRVVDPAGPLVSRNPVNPDSDPVRVIRGGDWCGNPTVSRCGWRSWGVAELGCAGFRLVSPLPRP